MKERLMEVEVRFLRRVLRILWTEKKKSNLELWRAAAHANEDSFVKAN